MEVENYFDHDADIGIIGRGETIEKCFADAAYNMFSLMADISQLQSLQAVTFDFEEEDVELALVIWLNSLLAKAREHNLIFCQFGIKRDGNQWKGTAAGEMWRDNIERGIEVKGATLSMLTVKKTNHIWEARCIVDV